MKTRSALVISLWYSLGVVMLLLVLFGAWAGVRLSRSTSASRSVLVTADNALVRYMPPPLRDTGDPKPLLDALEHSIRYYRQLSPHAQKRFGKDSVPVSTIIETLEDVRSRLQIDGFSPAFFEYLAEHYLFYKTSAERTLVTGYYEAEVEGSYVPDSSYRFPLYAPPTDLVRLREPAVSLRVGDAAPERVGRLTESGQIVPFYDRRQIDDDGVLRGRGLELVYLKDPIARFFLQVQGSGTIRLPNGESVRVGFAAKNGLPYRPIGRLLIERGILAAEQVTMQSIRTYLEQHPDEQREIFAYNESYVFFRFVEEGPIGSIGVPVTPYRTIATDARIFPNGALAFLITDLPTTSATGAPTRNKRSFSGLVVNQDTGDAIRGPGRVDLFTGRGAVNESVAGRMRESGVLYFLLKKRVER